MMHKIRTTIQPDKELEVDDTEYKQLRRQGLLVKEANEIPADADLENSSESAVATNELEGTE